MPELPEAETIARQLHARLAGKLLGDTYLARRDIVKTKEIDLPHIVSGRRVVSVDRRAKRVVLNLDPPATLVFGLGMTGRLMVVPRETQLEKHTHLRIVIPSLDAELRFRDPRRFGGVWLYQPGGGADLSFQDNLHSQFGIEPLTCTANQFSELVRKKRQIKALLMDQRSIAGLGNIYCDESLHAAGIHPLRVASSLSLDESSKLLKAIKATLRRAIRSKGSTLVDYRGADGNEGAFQRLHRVYGREGEPCQTCGMPIRRIQAAGRSTHFCPKCQPRKGLRRRLLSLRKTANR